MGIIHLSVERFLNPETLQHVEDKERKDLITVLRKGLDYLYQTCPHNIDYTDKEDRGATCSICGIGFGWYCPESPDKRCHYDFRTQDGVTGIRLITREILPISEFSINSDVYNDGETCLFCGNPEERK